MLLLSKKVRNEGAISLVNARHPVLLLRGKEPVGNNMALDENRQSLVLTGPNAGKMVVMRKTNEKGFVLEMKWSCVCVLKTKHQFKFFFLVSPKWY